MILELLPLSRLKRELNRIVRQLDNGNPEVYIITCRGERVAYVLNPELFHEMMDQVDHAELENALLKKKSLSDTERGNTK
ncbi:type II toxin-antitoxin system Phd/YefM family antitoxin [Spongiibacter nanhainus]|uniref:Type II toxin-antitoxin system Phd/YefM family antitoxin n=1 Tax=Spongiibacter nanhainus TaxID=2794344 RepID=A0A7T4QZ21_9GAMM|nr:type II toxin-antitoxin system Phd/YefM family antitoxin [Spongiibacter nanhainus]QQD17299.1 type II toxin-antitoxin system Phd/YefM family antitoxin [Spongiibacter nanhainus]